MIIVADNKEKKQLKKIWMECYEDPEEYVDFFFQNGFGKCTCICESSGDLILGALYLFECCIVPFGQPAFYWYAGGVLPSFRGQGIYRKIIDHALYLAKEEGRVSLCFPAPGLDKFYRKMGMADDYLCNVFQFRLENDGAIFPLNWKPLSLDESINIFRKTENACTDGSVVWQKDTMEYVVKENLFCNGFCDMLSFEGMEYYLFGQKHNAKLYISETNIPLPIMMKIKNSLMLHYKASAAQVKYPAGRYTENGCEAKQVLTCMGNGGFEEMKKWFVLNML